jgi:magnesium transporter
MVTRHEQGRVQWIDLETPTREELHEIMQEFGIDSRIEEELSGMTPYPIAVSASRYLYLTLHFPITSRKGGATIQEIDFIIGKQFLITARYEPVRSIYNLHRVFEAEELLGVPVKTTTAELMLERILRRLYGSLLEEVEDLGRKLEHIEEDIFSGKERQTVYTISEVNRILLRFDTTIGRHAESLSSLLAELASPVFFGKSFTDRSARIEAEREHVANLIDSYRDVASELRDTNDSLLSASQNEVMKNLTVITFIILPLSLIVSVFQMNVNGVPLAKDPHAFWIIIGSTAIISAILIIFTKLKHWL